MANSVSHAALPYPIKGARYTIGMVFLDADGDPIDPTTPDTERSIDGAGFSDCTEEVTTVSTGFGYITLTGDETNGSLIMVAGKASSGPKTTPVVIYPRVLPAIRSNTAQAGANGSITLDASASAVDDYYNGAIVKTTGGTGGAGGSGSLGNQARVITDYNGTTKVATVVPNWETNPSSDTTFDVLATAEWVSAMAISATVSGTVSADVVSISGDSTAADNAESFFDGTGYAGTNNVIPTTTTVTNAVTANVTQISGSTTAADNLEASALGVVSATAITGTLTATQFTTSLTEATNDHYNGRVVVFTSGVLAGQAKAILDYDGSAKALTTRAFTEAPGNADAFVIV